MKRKLKLLFKNKDNKALLENFISLSALQLIGIILPLITLPYILRVIGFDNYGAIVFAASLITYFTALTDFSFKFSATRDVAIFKNSPSKLNLIYSKVVTIKAIFFIISLLIITIVVLCYKPFYEHRLVYFLTVPMLLGQALFPDWFFQGIEKMRYITFLNLGVKLFFTLCVFIFITKEEDYWIYPLLQSAGFVGAGIIGQVILVKKYKLKFLLLNSNIIKSTIKSNIPIFVNQFTPTLYNNSSTFLLGLLSNNTFVGIYEAIKILINLCVTLIEILSRVFFPFLNRKKEEFGKYKKMILLVSIFLTFMCLASHKLVFWYLNINHENAFLVLAILAFGLLGYALYNIFGVNYFLIIRQDRVVMKNTIQSSLMGFVLAFPLIYFFGMIGAAINLSLTRWIMGGGLYLKYKQHVAKLL